MLYSSGTTGRPKGVLLSHGNLLSSAEAVVDGAELPQWKWPRITLSAMPIAHIFGVAIMHDLLMTPDYLADQTRLIQLRWFEPEQFMSLIHKHRCTATAAVPTILAVLLHHPKSKGYRPDVARRGRVRRCSVAGGTGPGLYAALSPRIREVYGLTEGTGLGTANRRTETYRPGSAGRAYCNTELAIFDEQDQPLPVGERGEICLRGPIVMQGYHNRPDETAQALRGGWLHTGDVGYLDADGYLFVVDRKKDMIIRGGENIYPAELEAVLHEHPAVAEAAVVGVPDEVYGENVVAFVVSKPARPSPRSKSSSTFAGMWPASKRRVMSTSCRRCPRATSAKSSAACCAKKRTNR